MASDPVDGYESEQTPGDRRTGSLAVLRSMGSQALDTLSDCTATPAAPLRHALTLRSSSQNWQGPWRIPGCSLPRHHRAFTSERKSGEAKGQLCCHFLVAELGKKTVPTLCFSWHSFSFLLTQKLLQDSC